MKLRTTSGVFAALVATATLVGCASGGSGGDQGSDEPLVLMHGSSPDIVAITLAATRDELAAEGVKAEIAFAKDGTVAMQSLSQEDVVLANYVASNVGIAAAQVGAPVRMVTGTAADSFQLVGGKGVESIDDLRGATFSIHSETSSTKIFADMFNEEYDLGLNYVIIPGSDVRAEALARGEVDGTFVDIQDVLAIENAFPEGSINVIARAAELVPELIEASTWMNSRVITEEPELAEQVVSAFVRGLKKISDDRDYAESLAVEILPEEDSEVLSETLRMYDELGLWDLPYTEEGVRSTIEFYSTIGELEIDPADITLSDFANFDLRQQAEAAN